MRPAVENADDEASSRTSVHSMRCMGRPKPRSFGLLLVSTYRTRLCRRQCLEVACRNANVRDGSGNTYERTGLCRTSASVKVKVVDT